MEQKYQIKIEVTDLVTNNVTAIDKTLETYSSLGWEASFDAEFSSLINNFMRLLGYPSYNKDYVVLESVTIDEYDRIVDFLDSLREEQPLDEK